MDGVDDTTGAPFDEGAASESAMPVSSTEGGGQELAGGTSVYGDPGSGAAGEAMENWDDGPPRESSWDADECNPLRRPDTLVGEQMLLKARRPPAHLRSPCKQQGPPGSNTGAS